MRLKPLGRLVLTVAVGVVVGVAGQALLSHPVLPERRRQTPKKLQWEHLEGEEGSDLTRVRTPSGWIVENVDGYLLLVPDPDHEWLEDE